MGKRVYVHFSFRRPRHKKYGIFAVAFYADEAGRQFMGSTTRAFKLWCDQQYITAIQSYEHALYCIWENQRDMMSYGVTDVVLMTDNSTLAKWIENPRKRPDYEEYMNRANRAYGMGGSKPIMLNISLHEALNSEKSHKFCTEERIRNKRSIQGNEVDAKYKSVTEVMKEEAVEINGIDVSNDYNNM